MPNVQRTPTKSQPRSLRVSTERLRHDSTASRAASTAGATEDDEPITIDDTCNADTPAKSSGASSSRRRRTSVTSQQSTSSLKRPRVASSQIDDDDMSGTGSIADEDGAVAQGDYAPDDVSTRIMIDPLEGKRIMTEFYDKIKDLKDTLLIDDSTSFEGSALKFLLSANDVIGKERRYKISNECQRELFRIYFTMLDCLHDKEKKIQELNHKIEMMNQQATLTGSASTLNSDVTQAPKRTFADIASVPGPFKPKGYEKKHVAVLETKTEGKKVEDIRKDLLTELAPKSSKIRIVKTTATKNGRLLVHCDSAEDVNLLKKQIAEKPKLGDLTCQTMTKLNPRVMIVGVTKEIAKEDLVDYIIGQNQLPVNHEDIKPRFSYAAGQHARNWIVETSPPIFQALMKKQRIFVGISSCRIENYVRTVRCYKCCRIGHIQANCTETAPRCARCQGEHLARDCKEKVLKCINCCETNDKYKKNYKTDHSALDSKCQTENFHRNRLLSKIDFGIEK